VQLISRCATTLTALRFSSLEAFSLCLRRRRALHASNVEYCCLFFRISRYRVLTYTFASVLSLASPKAKCSLSLGCVAFGERQPNADKGGFRLRRTEAVHQRWSSPSANEGEAKRLSVGISRKMDLSRRFSFQVNTSHGIAIAFLSLSHTERSLTVLESGDALGFTVT
jgi:hypothetical protein